MRIGNIDTDEKVLVIAEVGNNHEGNYDLAEKMIKLAAASGADAVKFQTIVPEELISPVQEERLGQLKKFQLSRKQFEDLKTAADKEKIMFMSTPFDIQSVDFLSDMVPCFKISSGDITFFPLIGKACATGKPVILSTGGADTDKIDKAVDFIKTCYKKNNIVEETALLHCVSMYPAAEQDVNILSVNFLRERYNVTVGYSDHTCGWMAPLLAVASGARIIEKHFTLDKHHSTFRDHQLSADPCDMGSLVEKIRLAEKMLGKYQKNVLEKELSKEIRRSIAVKRDMSAGETIKKEDIYWIRPGTGISPENEGMVVGKTTKRPIKKGSLVSLDELNA